MSRPMWQVRLIRKAFPYLHFAARLTRVPLLGRLVERMNFEGDDIVVLTRDSLIGVNEDVGDGGGVFVPSVVVEHFISEAGHLWIMNSCICRESMGCKDYPIDLGCLFMGEAVKGINPELGRFVTREEALEHLKRCREAGLFHIIGKNKLDTVWLKVGPGDRLLTVCNCCPCCCVWRMLPEISKSVSSKVSSMPGVTVEAGDGCAGCGTCTEACFARAITLEDGKAVIGENCKGCGNCALACPEGAITIAFSDDSFVKKSIDRISSNVSV